MENYVYELVNTASIYDRIPISEYVSRRTGLTVMISEFEGPMVNISFQLLTETFDDDGIPNALRHLIFMGSEEYPYKNFPHVLANEYLGTEITSRIGTLHTTYTTNVLTSTGLATILPVIGDHILFPLLTEEAFITEIHHITEEGRDAGVLYLDLEENTEYLKQRFTFAVVKNMYPGKCSYASKIHGTKKSLRESVTIAKIREYHKKFYRTENLKIIVTGNVNPKEVFEALNKLEEKVLSKGMKEPFQRPFQSDVPPLTEPTTDVIIRYPTDYESNKHTYYIGWRTVSCVTNSYTLLAINMLLEYLTESSVSPLVKEYAEDENDSIKIWYQIIRNKESCVYIDFNYVPPEKIPRFKQEVDAVFRKIIQNKDIDLGHMKTVITQLKLKDLIHFENYPCHAIESMVARYAAFGKSDQFQSCFNPLLGVEKLLEEPATFWIDILERYFVENKNICIQFIPNREGKEHIIKEENDISEIRKKLLTESELKEKGEMLKRAISLNEREPPQELFFSIQFPDIASVKFHSIERFNSDSSKNEKNDFTETPVFTYFDSINASTVFLQAFLCTDDVPKELQIYLPFYFEYLMDLPMEKDGILIPHEELKRQLDADIIYRWTDAQSYSLPHLAAVCVEVENSKYETGLRWLSDILYRTTFTVERIKHFATQKLKDYIDSNGIGVQDFFYNAINALCFAKDSRIVRCGELQQKRFITDILDKIDGTGSKEILDNFQKIKTIVTDPSRIVLYIAANINKIESPVKSVEVFLPSNLKPSNKKQRLYSQFPHNFLQFDDSMDGCIIGNNFEDNKNFQFCRVTKTVTSLIDPDYAALKIYLNYINHDKGPIPKEFKKYTRFILNVEEGLFYFNCYRGENIMRTYNQIKESILNNLETKNWNEHLLRNVQRSALYEHIEDESTFMDIVAVSRRAYFENIDNTYHRKMFDFLSKVTVDDLYRVGKKYIAPIFDTKTSKTVACAHVSKIKEYADEMKKLGIDLRVYSSAEESFLSSL